MATGGLVNSDEVACSRADGVLTISNVAMQRAAWLVPDVRPLWDDAEQAGQNLSIPGAPWPLPELRRGAETVVALRLLVDGRYTSAGAATAVGERQQMRENLRYLGQYVTRPTYTGDGTRLVQLTDPAGGYTAAAYAHVSMRIGESVGPLTRCVLTLSFPQGLPV